MVLLHDAAATHNHAVHDSVTGIDNYRAAFGTMYGVVDAQDLDQGCESERLEHPSARQSLDCRRMRPRGSFSPMESKAKAQQPRIPVDRV